MGIHSNIDLGNLYVYQRAKCHINTVLLIIIIIIIIIIIFIILIIKVYDTNFHPLVQLLLCQRPPTPVFTCKLQYISDHPHLYSHVSCSISVTTHTCTHLQVAVYQ